MCGDSVHGSIGGDVPALTNTKRRAAFPDANQTFLQFVSAPPVRQPVNQAPLDVQLLAFRDFGKATRQTSTAFEQGNFGMRDVPTFINEFWTAKQRQAHSLHEISYRACFKPQLPKFFIDRLTEPEELVYDPFMGRGTTLLEAALLGRVPAGETLILRLD